MTSTEEIKLTRNFQNILIDSLPRSVQLLSNQWIYNTSKEGALMIISLLLWDRKELLFLLHEIERRSILTFYVV